MPTTKPTKPNITLPSAFGTSVSNVKTEFTAQELIDGYSASIPQVLDGGNVNWLNDALFRYLTYVTVICDWLNGLGVNKVPFINSSNQLDGVAPVLQNANNTFTENNTFEKPIISTATTPIYTKRSDYTMGVAPSSTKDNTIGFQDSTNAFAGYVNCEYNANGTNTLRIVARNKNNGNIISAGIDVWANLDGTTGITASGSVKSGIVDWCTPKYSTMIDCNGYTSSSNQFTAPSAGVIYGATQGNATLYINNTVVKTLNTLGYPGYPFFYVLSKGDKFYGTFLTDCHFSPMKGV